MTVFDPSLTTPKTPGVFVVRELEGPNGGPGRSVAFTGVEIRALGYADLASAKLHAPLTVALAWDNAKIISSDVEGLDLAALYRANTTLESPFTSLAVCLMKGGWLPSSLATTTGDATILLDRNVVPQLIAASRRQTSGAPRQDFLDLFARGPVRLHPLLYAMEGNGREIPTPDEVHSQMAEVVDKLRSALPQAEIIADPGVLQGALGLLDDARAGFARRTRFLQEVAPLLAAPVGRREVRARWRNILAAADVNGVARSSLVVLAALSAAAVPNGRSPARSLLKCARAYSAGDAYNALADLRSLELLLGLFALAPDQQIHLCTCDKALALFWVGLRASNVRRVGPAVTFDLAPVPELLPGEALDWWRADVATTASATPSPSQRPVVTSATAEPVRARSDP